MSAFSSLAVLLATTALVIIISVFNGFEELVHSLHGSFNPDLLITPKEGKTFVPEKQILSKLLEIDGVIDYAEVVEDKALIKYDDQQTDATIKGVSANYPLVSGVDSMMREGNFQLYFNDKPQAIVGMGIAYYLNINLGVRMNYRPPISIYVPRREAKISLNPQKALKRGYINPIGIFSIEQAYDSKYILTPIEFARELFDYDDEVSSLEIKIDPGKNEKKIQEKVALLFGEEYKVKNELQQDELFYKTMQSEKYIIFLIFSLIIIISSFNIIGSLTMLILEKKEDIFTLRSLGASLKTIKRIFLFEGWMMSIIGAFFGLILGLIICWIQQTFGLIKLQAGGSFVIDSYPIVVKLGDVLLAAGIVVIIGLLTAWYPILFFTRKYILSNEEINY